MLQFLFLRYYGLTTPLQVGTTGKSPANRIIKRTIHRGPSICKNIIPCVKRWLLYYLHLVQTNHIAGWQYCVRLFFDVWFRHKRDKSRRFRYDLTCCGRRWNCTMPVVKLDWDALTRDAVGGSCRYSAYQKHYILAFELCTVCRVRYPVLQNISNLPRAFKRPCWGSQLFLYWHRPGELLAGKEEFLPSPFAHVRFPELVYIF